MTAPALPSPTRARLVTRAFLIVSVSTFAFFVAIGITLPVLPRFVKDELGGSSLAVGVVVAALSVAAIVSRPLLSVIGERNGRRALMIGGGLLAAAAFALTGPVPGLAVLLVLRMLAGLGEAAQFVGAATLINDLSAPERRAEAASYFSVAVFGGLGIGPLVGEAFADRGAFTAAFLAAAGCCVVSTALALLAPDRPGATRPAPGSPEPVRPPLFHPRAFGTGAVLAMAMFGYTAWVAFLPLQATNVGMSAGALFLAYSVLVLVLRVAGARIPERVGLGRCAAAALCLIGAGLLVMALLGTRAGLTVGTVVLGVGISLLYPALMAVTVNGVGDHERASVVSTFTMFFEVGGALGGIVLGGIAAATSYLGAFAAGGVVALAGLPVLWRWVLVPRRSPPVAR